MIALSIRQPWAWLIINGGKDIENRNWKTPFRGTCLIHASKSGNKAEYEYALDYLAKLRLDRIISAIPSIDQLDRGGIVGSVDIIDCVENSASPWYMGHFGFVLRNPKPLHLIQFKGRLGFFNVPDDVLKGGTA